MSKEVILIFDIGKTNKKILLFDPELKLVHEEEEIFPEIMDDDGFLGDDIERLEKWVLASCKKYIEDPDSLVRGINFTTYGATLMYLDSQGNRLTPVYNYLKPMSEEIPESLYINYGGREEFCRNTASPALGMLNSGLQILWLKNQKKNVFEKVRHIVHFPQYLSSLLTGRISSEHTSIGCHTALWDFDNMKYHNWLVNEGIQLPDPLPLKTTFPAEKVNSEIPVGIGIHDSSASLVPYFRFSKNAFILVSTGTWCINMNPFNHSPLTSEQLSSDCLAYMSIRQKPVKSSRFFLGHIHDVNVQALSEYFNVEKDAYKTISPDNDLLVSFMNKDHQSEQFFRNGIPEEYIDSSINLSEFKKFSDAYHRLLVDLSKLAADSIKLIMEEPDNTEDIYITGGFARNPIFTGLMATHFFNKNVFTSEIANATSLGAALVFWKNLGTEKEPVIDLGLKLIEQPDNLINR